MDEKTQKFVDKALAVHNNKYDYSLVEYQRQYSLVDIICPQHGVFHQTPKLHLKGHGCRKCSGCEADQDTFLKKQEQNTAINLINLSQFIQEVVIKLL